MSGRAALPRIVIWALRLVIPRHAATVVIDDLNDEYAIVRQRVNYGAARRWLIQETTSLLRSYAAEVLRAIVASGPLFARDLALVWRGIRSRPLASLGGAMMVATGMLALLVAAALSTTLLFRPVSATYGEALRRVAAVDKQGRSILRLSYPELHIVREHLDGAARVSVVNLQPVMARMQRTSVQTMAEVVDGNYFALAGVATVLGRGLMAHDDRPDSSLVAVISQPFARDWFGSSSSPIGQHLALNGTTFTVVGVTTALGSSSFLGASVDVWVPLAHADALLNRGWRTNVDERWFTTYALPTGGAGEVEARLAAAASALTRRYPDTWRDRRLRTIAGTIIAGSQRRAAIVVAATLSALAALILVVAAANLGGLLLAHAAADKRAAAIHLSLGCGRRALARRLLIEGAALGMIASILAVGGYAWTRMWFANIALFPTLALRLELARPSSVALWALVGGLFLGAALAVGPAFWAMRIDPAEALRDAGSRAIGNRGLARTRRVMVALQVAVSLVLVVGAALFTRSLAALVNVDVGFERSRLIAMDFDVEPSSVPQSALPALAREAVARVSALPGITNVAMSNRAPIDPSTPTVEVQTRPGAPPVGDVSIYLATPGYFEAIGLPLLSGRSFSQAEAERNADVVIVNQTLGARLWPHDDAVDRVLTLVDGRKTLRVVGVARDSKYRALGEPPRPHIYRPTAPALSLTLLARTAGDPYESLRAIQQALDGVGPGLVGFFPRTLTDHVAVELLPTRAAAAAAQWIGALALLFSCVGLYGLVSWFVELRRREIGIRMALGASARDVRALIVKHSLQAALPGTIGGLLMSVALARLSRAALFGVGPLDLAAFGAALAAIVIVVAGASYVPSRRATRVDPAMTLRLP